MFLHIQPLKYKTHRAGSGLFPREQTNKKAPVAE